MLETRKDAKCLDFDINEIIAIREELDICYKVSWYRSCQDTLVTSILLKVIILIIS